MFELRRISNDGRKKCAPHCSKHFVCINSLKDDNSPATGSTVIIIPIFQTGQLGHREAVTCARSHSWEVAP